MKRSRARAAGFHVTCAALAVLFLTPMLWALYSSLHGRTGTGPLGLDNYRRLLHYGSGLPAYMANTAFVAIVTVAVTVVATTLGGYAVARFSFRGKNLLFMLTLTILMVPLQHDPDPAVHHAGWLGLQNSLLGLALVLAMFQLPFGLFMMRNSFEALPVELEEAALVDGCSAWPACCATSCCPASCPASSPSRCSRSSRRGTSSWRR